MRGHGHDKSTYSDCCLERLVCGPVLTHGPGAHSASRFNLWGMDIGSCRHLSSIWLREAPLKKGSPDYDVCELVNQFAKVDKMNLKDEELWTIYSKYATRAVEYYMEKGFYRSNPPLNWQPELGI